MADKEAGEPAAQPLLETGDHDLKDPAKMTEESAGWQKTLFEVFLARAENISKYDFTVGYPDGLEDGVKYGEVDFAQYKKLSEEQRAEIREAFLASQTQESVDEKMAFMDDKKGSFDCFESNKVQGYWNARAFYDPAWVGQTLSRDSAWTKKEKTFLKWAPTAVPFGYFLCGIGILKHWFPFVTYGVEALFVVALLYFYLKWLAHLVRGGWSTWWTDITVERTFPGSIRYFSIDYWSVFCAGLLWLFFDNLGGLKALWVLAVSGGVQLVYAVHCTFSTTDPSVWLGVAYLVASIAWVLLWMPSQSMWLAGAELGSSYKGRGGLAKINPNIEYMFLQIMMVGVPLLIEFAAFMFMEVSWWVLLLMFPAAYCTIRHIGFAALVFMGIAKLTAHSGRSAYDPYGICIGTGWF